MRLLKKDEQGNLILVQHEHDNVPPYAILSHTWGPDSEEVTYKDLVEGTGKDKAGYAKLDFCVKQSALHGLEYFWVDTCSIDKSSSAELTEAINSMFNWYHNAARCYVYLSDVSIAEHATDPQSSRKTWETAFRNSRWFTRGWTLQELLAPASVEFFSKEGHSLGDKKSMESTIHTVTSIAVEALSGKKRLTDFTVQERMAWATHRKTKRPEDKAYSLLGLFAVFMPLIYGEGEENAFERLREQINKSSRAPRAVSETLPMPSSMVPFRPDNDFVDRTAEGDHGTLLDQIERLCAAPASRVALVGIGGAGKSQLAIEFCHRLRKKSPNTWIFWIHASNAERIEQGYRELAELVRIPGRDDPQHNIFELVARWLRNENNARWFLVLDNVDDDVVLYVSQPSTTEATQATRVDRSRRLISAYLPQSANGALLVTSRTRHVASKLVEPRDIVMVEPMVQDDAVALLRKKLGNADVDSDLKELAGILEHMPLAMVQAAAFIQQKGQNYPIRRYIEEFRRNDKRKASLLNYEGGQIRRDPDAKNAILVTWQLSFDYIRKEWPSSANLLALMSFFDRQGIPKEALTVRILEERHTGQDKIEDRGGQDDFQNDDASLESSDTGLDWFEESMDCLRNYSFISTGVDGETYEMHRLVQLATRKWLEMQGEDERWRSEFVQRLNAVFPEAHYENWRACERLLPHAKAAEEQQPADGARVREWGQILVRAGSFAFHKGNLTEAERIQDKTSRRLQRLLGADDSDTLCSMNDLSMTLRKLGRFAEAEKVGWKVSESFAQVLGPDHPSTQASINNLALACTDQGKWTEAEKLIRQVLETEQKVLGTEHEATLTSMNNLAAILCDQGRWSEAEKIEEQVLEARVRMLGPEHPLTLLSMGNLAAMYSEQEREAEAEKLEIQVLETCTRILGPEHPDTIGSMGNLATTYLRQERKQEAEKLQLQVLELRQKIQGPEHSNTLRAMSNLAVILWANEKRTEAFELLSDCVQLERRILGQEHPRTLGTSSTLTKWSDEQQQGHDDKSSDQV